MAEEGGDNPTGGGAGGENPAPSGLPSEQGGEGSISFEIKPEDLQDGKFMGKWSTPQEMADHIKNIEDKHANLTRDIADKTKQTDAEIQQTADEAQKLQLQNTTVRELLPEFLKNGMVVTPEMGETLKATGLTEQDIKIGAYEFKEALDLNASYVGGKENYDIIMDYHAENMTPEQKVQFNHSIQDPNNSEALMVGLQTMYEKSVGAEEGTPVDRVRGNAPAAAAIQPYTDKASLLKDKAYADSRVSSAADKAKFRQRLNVTPDKVWLS